MTNRQNGKKPPCGFDPNRPNGIQLEVQDRRKHGHLRAVGVTPAVVDARNCTGLDSAAWLSCFWLLSGLKAFAYVLYYYLPSFAE